MAYDTRVAGLAGAFLDLLYPPVCAACGEEPWEPDEVLGERCLAEVRWAAGRDCLRCGRVLGEGAARESCLDCRHRPLAFRRVVCAAAYEGPVRSLVRRMKARRELFLAEAICRWLLRRLAAEPLPPFDVVACVPMHWSARVLRGFNPAEILARRAARALGVPFDAGLLLRARRGERQTGKSRGERIANAEGLYAAGRSVRPDGARVLVVDDVVTTGSTLSACARVLRADGAAEVFGAAAARA